MLFLFLGWNLLLLVQEMKSDWVGCKVLCEIPMQTTTVRSTWRNISPQYMLYSEQMMAGNV